MINPFFHTVSIHKCEGAGPEFVGSGVLLRIEGKEYIATAAHVVDDMTAEVGIGVVKEIVKWAKDQPARIFAKKQDSTYKDGLDLALLLVTSKYRQFLAKEGMSFFDLDKNHQPPVTDVCIILGYPGKMNRYVHKKRRYADSCNCLYVQSFMKNAERVLAIGGDPEFHFALEIQKRGNFQYCATNMTIPELFDLGGMSGGGVWHMPRDVDVSIRACATAIAGILIEDWDTQNNRQGLAKVVKIDAIRNLINFAKSQPETLFFVE